MRRTLAILSVLAALMPASLSTPAHAAPEESLLLEDSGNTPGWAAYIVTSEGGRYELDWRFPVTRDPVQIGVLHYDGDNNWLGGYFFTGFTYQNSYRYEVNAIPGMPLKAEEVQVAHGVQQSIQAGGPLPGSSGNPVA